MLHTLQAWLEKTPLSPYVRDAVWAKVLLESVHILADAVVLSSAGSIAVQLLLRASDGQVLRRQAPWLWGGLGVAAVTGLALLIGAGRWVGWTVGASPL